MASRLERLFDLYSRDLERYAPSLKECFGCPICLRGFRKVRRLGDVVGEEHIVPEALGGRLITLTCRQCNSDHGAKLDAHLVQRVLVEANRIPVRVRMKMGSASMGAEMDGAPDPAGPISIRGVKKQSDEKQVEQIKELLRDGKTEIKLHMSLGYNENRSLVALVRSAYLLMFRTFGYRYVFDASAATVREQLKNPMEKTAKLDGIMWRIEETIPEEADLCIMHTPEWLRSFFIVLRLDEQRHVAGVTLPPPGTDGSDLYPRLRAPDTQGKKLLHPLPIPTNGFLPFLQAWRFAIRESGGDAPLRE